MEFFVHHHGRAGSEPLRERMVEAHWAYMDRFADHLIARGPTFTQETLVGSVHIVDLPDPATARAFAFEEPCYQAGAFDGVLIHRWRNRAADADRFLVLGLGVGTGEDRPRTDPEPLIAYGPVALGRRIDMARHRRARAGGRPRRRLPCARRRAVRLGRGDRLDLRRPSLTPA
ncbi:YciI family protein [Luteipulveratus halotolerans]|uniref:YciI family protein n=1 Tax=Luteipulveratus halotolerans TaxID=1631356 RepID=UPI000B140581|nr:YciI family protein [Luteipulveratus halotolerans]